MSVLQQEAPPAPIAEGGTTTIRQGQKQDVRERAKGLLERMAAASQAAPTEDAEDDSPAVAADDGEDEATPTAKPKPAAAKSSKLDELDAKRNEGRARLKKRDAESEAERERAAERAEWAQERAQMRAVIQKLQAFDPDRPETRRKILQELGGDEVARFILEDSDPVKRAEREAAAARQPAPIDDADKAEVRQLKEQLNAFIGAQQRRENEAAFTARVAEFDHEEEGGAPLTAALLKKKPQEAINMAYAFAQQRIASKKPFDDDDLIGDIEERLGLYASLREPKKQASKQEAPTSLARSVIEHDEDESADAPPADEPKARKKPTTLNAKLDNKQRLLERAKKAQRIVNELYGKR